MPWHQEDSRQDLRSHKCVCVLLSLVASRVVAVVASRVVAIVVGTLLVSSNMDANLDALVELLELVLGEHAVILNVDDGQDLLDVLHLHFGIELTEEVFELMDVNESLAVSVELVKGILRGHGALLENALCGLGEVVGDELSSRDLVHHLVELGLVDHAISSEVHNIVDVVDGVLGDTGSHLVDGSTELVLGHESIIVRVDHVKDLLRGHLTLSVLVVVHMDANLDALEELLELVHVELALRANVNDLNELLGVLHEGIRVMLLHELEELRSLDVAIASLVKLLEEFLRGHGALLEHLLGDTWVVLGDPLSSVNLVHHLEELGLVDLAILSHVGNLEHVVDGVSGDLGGELLEDSLELVLVQGSTLV